MQWAVSDLAFGGFNKKYLSGLPLTYNIEFFYEFGTDHYWDTVLLPLAQNNKEKRTFSIHGPCVAVNLADSSDEYYLKAYAQTFTYAQKIKAEFVVVHTNESYHGEVAAVKELVYQRLTEVISLAQSYGVQVVIENVGLRPCGSLLFDFEEYLALFERYPQALALLDTGHAHVNGWNLPETVKRLQNWERSNGNLILLLSGIMHRMHCRYWNMLILSREFLPNTCISWKAVMVHCDFKYKM